MRKKGKLITKHFHRNFVKKDSMLLETFKTICNKVLQNVSKIFGEELSDKAYQDLATVLAVIRARICKRLWSPGINSEESISLAYVAWRSSTTNRVSYRPARPRIDTWSP